MRPRKSIGVRALVLATLMVALLSICTPAAHAQNYVTILYETWANELMPGSPVVGNDVSQMMLNPYTTGNNWWGKPYFASITGDGTIKNNYLDFFGNSGSPNSALIDYHADLLSRAGIDFISIDFTNGSLPNIVEGARALCNRFQQRAAAGLPCPKIAFFVQNANVLQEVKNDFYNVYPSSLFFYYQGKPFAEVAVPNTALGAGDRSQPYAPTGGIFDSFTCRHCWGLDTSGSFWQFKTSSSTPPPASYFNGAPEEMSAAFASQSTYMTVDGVNPAAGAQGRNDGAFFNTYWNSIIQVRPTFTFITGWNEWVAINLAAPPAGTFTDQWKEAYSSDAEPEAFSDPGSHGFQYYDLMAEKIGQLKTNLPVVSGQSYTIYNQNSGEAIDVPNGTNVHGTPLQQWPANGLSPQAWRFTDLGDGYWTIVNAGNGLALDDYGWQTNLGAAVDQWDNWGGSVQQWSLRPVGDGSYKIFNRNSHLCLAIQNASKANNAALIQWDDNGTPDHNWYIAPYIADGSYKIVASTTGNVLDVTGLNDGALAQLHPYAGGANQKWNIHYLGNGRFSILNANGRSLDCSGCSPDNGTNVELWDYWGGLCQQWIITPVGNGAYRISTANPRVDGSHDVLDGFGCSGNTGAQVGLWTWDGGGCQQTWLIQPSN